MIDKYEELYLCYNRNSQGIIAKGEEWVILKGSKIAEKDTCSYAKNGRTQRLIDDGYIQNNIFVKDYPVKTKTVGVSIIGRHGVSASDGEKKSCHISLEEAKDILNNNMNKTVEQDVGLESAQEEKNSEIKKNNSSVSIEICEELVTDIMFQKLKSLQKEVNIFSIVGQTHTEHWHSSFFKWLFDPKSSLGLGRFALERLLSLYIMKKDNSCILYDDIENLDLDDIDFVNEKVISNTDYKEWNRGAIDVYGESEELIIVIENKVTAKEEIRGGIGQTSLYYDYTEKNKSEDQKCIYIFITPDPNQQPICSEYVQITYQEIFDFIISKCINNPEIVTSSKYVLEQYSSNLRMPYKKDSKQYPMALIHIPMCEQIYKKYSKVFEEVFICVESRDVNSLGYSIYKKYEEVFDEIYMSVDKYGKTPDSEMERKFITFEDLVNSKKLSEDTTFYMNYDGMTLYGKLVKNSQLNEWCMALLNQNMEMYVDEYGNVLEEYFSYRTPSRAAGDAVYLARLNKGDLRERPSLNGRDYWIVCGEDIKLSELMK